MDTTPRFVSLLVVQIIIYSGFYMSRPFGRSSMMFECHLCEVIYRSHHIGILY